MARILIKLSPDRTKCGALTLEGAEGQMLSGPFLISGRASDGPAREHQNESRNPLMRYGDTPTGIYRVSGILKSGDGTAYSSRQYGSNGVIVLDPVSGDAALADANGRYHIFIQGGAAGRGRKLRSTNGCLRLMDVDQAKLIEAIRDLGAIVCDCSEDPTVAGGGAVLIDNSYNEGDPPAVLARESVEASIQETKFSRRAVLRGAAIGAAATAMQTISLGHTIFVARRGPKLAESVGFEGVAMAYGPDSSGAAPEQAAPPAAPPRETQSGPEGSQGPTAESPAQGPPGPAGPPTQPFGTGGVPPEKAGLSPEVPPSGSGGGGAVGQAQGAQGESSQGTTSGTNEGAAGHASQPFDVQNPGGSGAPTVQEGSASAPEQVPDAMRSNPQYQQLQQQTNQSEQQYNDATKKADEEQQNFKDLARQPGVTADQLRAADQAARDANVARQKAFIENQQNKEKVKTFVLDQGQSQSPPPKKDSQ